MSTEGDEHERGQKGVQETENGRNTIIKGATPSWIQSGDVDYISKSQDREKPIEKSLKEGQGRQMPQLHYCLQCTNPKDTWGQQLNHVKRKIYARDIRPKIQVTTISVPKPSSERKTPR